MADSEQQPTGTNPARSPKRYGGSQSAKLIAGAMLGNMVSVNTVLTFTIGIFISTFHASYGWARADIALSMTSFTVVAFVGSSLIGRAADRYATRRLAVLSSLAFGVGLLMVPLFVRSVEMLWIAYLMLAVLGIATSPVVMNRPVMAAFSRHRGLAIALALTGTGIGGFVLPQLTAGLVALGGWRYGFFGLGILVLTAAPLLWLLMSGEPTSHSVPVAPQSAPDPRIAVGTLFRSRPFWVLSLIALCGGLGMSGPAAHLVPLLGDHGIGAVAAARLVSIIGVASVTGRLLTGVGLDRFDSPLAGIPLLGLGAAGLWLLSQFSVETAPLGIAMLGFVIGAEIALLAYFSSRYFALAAQATIFGWAYGIVALGSAIGPVAVGALRDHQGSYATGFLLSGMALLLASLSCLMLGPYRYAASE